MFDDYIALDVETATGRAPSICSIGIVHVINGKVEDRCYRLINPQTDFDVGTIAVHGITPEMVKDAPVFSQVWEEIKHYFVGNIVVAHNATFDLSQLAYSLKRIGSTIPSFYYLDTVSLARRAFPGQQSYSLGRLTYQLHLSYFDHHHALADAHAAQALFERIKKEMPLKTHHLRRYSIYRDVSILKATEFLQALRIRDILFRLQSAQFISDHDLQALADERRSMHDSQHLALRELTHLIDQLLHEGFVFSSLIPQLTLLWDTFFPSSGFKGILLSLQILREDQGLLQMRPNDLQPWLDYHQELQHDPLLAPVFRHLQHDPGSQESSEAIQSLIRPYDAWESLEGKVVATCGRFIGCSAEEFLSSREESFEIASSLSRKVDVLIVGGRLQTLERVLREAMLYRLENPHFRIIFQLDETSQSHEKRLT